MRYTTSLDKKALLVTFGITTLLFIVTALQLMGQQTVTSMLLAILLASVYGIAFALSPKSYELTGSALTIEKRLGKIVLPRNEIKEVKLLKEDALKRSLRIFGVGGLFGYYGKFSNANLGKMTWYATRGDRAVLVTTTTDKKIILTPDEATNFVAEFNKA
jgi:hypothetical protein